MSDFTKTKKYKALLAILGDADQAKVAYERAKATKAAPAVEAPAAVETAKEKLARQVAEAGLSFTRGRVYMTPAIVEAVARCLRSGKAQIVQASGNGHVTHVLIAKEESGDCSVQNLQGAKA